MRKSIKSVIIAVSIILLLFFLVLAVAYSRRVYLKKAYPVKYSELVEKYCAEYDLDPYFVYSVIRTESNFQPNVKSSIGARGLMQFTNDTFDWVKGRLKDKDATYDDMYNEEKAIEYGCYLLSYLKNNLGSNTNVLCGYHAGINITKNWLTNETYSQNGEIIYDKIPYGDTKQYVNKVLSTYKIYTELYSKGE